MNRLVGNVAIVTGAARGIGAGVAERLIAEGARVIIGDTETAAGEEIAARLGGPPAAQFVKTDVSVPADIEGVVAAALAAHGRLDIMVQNAGIFPWQLIENTTPEDWDRVLTVNLRSAFLAARAALAPMRRQAYGRIVFTSSITGPRVTSPGHGHYSASKAGINGFIRSAALEFASYGITVNGVEPGNIMTEGVALHRTAAFIKSMEDMIPAGRLGLPADVANVIAFLAAPESGYITGTTIIVDGGQTLPEGSDFKTMVQPA